MAAFILMMGAFGSAAAEDFKVCCVKAARRNFTLYPEALPWEVCGVSVGAGSADGTNPSVNTTLGWCKSNCPGHPTKNTSKFIHLMLTRLGPDIGRHPLC